ncbi:helix-turn-helix transcriptional regulator [Psychromicrobium sp. YIM B11713]|uniref:helix-turn-helix transcriptional regulator n=1 Tax=Psychromicrobium sp. YIM B11713 TaxID=3145233 RepID=UPI00374FD284
MTITSSLPRSTTPSGALPPAQAAEFLGVAVKTMANWRTDGVGPSYVRYGTRGRVAYLLADLQAYMQKNRIVTAN